MRRSNYYRRNRSDDFVLDAESAVSSWRFLGPRSINIVSPFSDTRIPPCVHPRARSWSPEELGLGGQKVKLPQPRILACWSAGCGRGLCGGGPRALKFDKVKVGEYTYQTQQEVQGQELLRPYPGVAKSTLSGVCAFSTVPGPPIRNSTFPAWGLIQGPILGRAQVGSKGKSLYTSQPWVA